MTDSLAERVERGATWLDGVDPDWAHRIDAATLNLADCTLCVLGQGVEGQFQSVADTFGLDRFNSPRDEWLTARGFDVIGFPRDRAVKEQHADLTDLWRVAIEARSGGTRKLDPLPLADVLPHLPGGAA